MQKYLEPSKSDKIKKRLLLIVVGIVTGFLNGFFGGGGGMLVVPAILAILKISEKESHATAIAIILPLSIVSAVVYIIKGINGGEWIIPTTIGVVIGGLLGASLLSKLSTKVVTAIFYIIMIIAGIRMIIA